MSGPSLIQLIICWVSHLIYKIFNVLKYGICNAGTTIALAILLTQVIIISRVLIDF